MGFDSTPPGDIMAEIRAEYDSAIRRLEENRLQIEQNEAEVKRWEEENVRASSQLRRIHDSFDSVPRPDIRAAYDGLIEAKSRLLNLRGQLEKMKQSQELLHRYSDIFGRLLQVLEGEDLGTSTMPTQQPTAPTTLTPAGETIIRIVQAQEDERRSLAKSLHDGPAQSLTNFILQAEVCQRLFDRDPDRASTELNNLKSAASNSFQKVRDFIFDLRPMMLDDLGLIPTLRRYVENFQQKYDIQLDINFTGEEQVDIAKHMEVMMFRSVQHLLRVSREYLDATIINIQVDTGSQYVTARVEDNGNGFNPDVDLDPQYGDSNVQTLNALRDRVELVGGDLDIYSEEDNGSRFQVRLPVYAETEESSFE